jgi:hypothetical protein
LGKFYDVAKVAMAITGRFSHIWLQAKNKCQFFMLFYIFGYLFEPCLEIWQIFLNFIQILVIENL